MTAWIDNLCRAVADKEVLILHGNVQDFYVESTSGDGGSSRVYDTLVELVRAKIQSLGQIRNIAVYDPVDKLKSMPNSQQDSDHSNVALANLLERWRDLLRVPGSQFALILPYLDKTIPLQEEGASNDYAFLRFVKLIQEIKSPNRLVLIVSQESALPTELYIDAPKVRVLQVPSPGSDERRCYVEHELADQLGRDLTNLAASLTDGLYLADLRKVIASLASESQLDQVRVRELINEYRIGSREDYFGKLDLDRLRQAQQQFQERVKGQEYAIKKVYETLLVARAGLARESKPKGVFFFVGPSGVGKTYLAQNLADFLFADLGKSFIRFDMSEFKEEHTTSKMIGSPPGYVGFTEGGALTRAIRERPFSVVLFDEIEKAHPRVLDLFLQILDEGRLTDSHGQTAFFTEAIIVFTSNIGARSNVTDGRESEYDALSKILKAESDPETCRQKVRDHYEEAVNRYFMQEISRPELLNRLSGSIVPFNHIDTTEVMLDIVRSHLDDLRSHFDRERADMGWTLQFDDSVAQMIVSSYKTKILEFGGRKIRDAIEREIKPNLAVAVLSAEMRTARHMCFSVGVDTSTGSVLVKDIYC